MRLPQSIIQLDRKIESLRANATMQSMENIVVEKDA